MADPVTPPGKKIVSRTVRMEEELDDLIGREASMLDRSFSDVLRRIVRRYYFGHAASLSAAAGDGNSNRVGRANSVEFRSSEFGSLDQGGYGG